MSTVNFDFRGRWALVVGGSSGIGQAIAAAFRDAGCEVVATGWPPDQIAAAAAGEPAPRALDATSPESIARVVDDLPRLDYLVNCAGVIARDGREFDLERFTRVIDVNLTGAMRVASACLPLLSRRGGAVVQIASMLGFFGSGRVPAYSASKGGVVQLTKSLAIAWAPRQVRANAVAPGWIRTPLTAPLAADERARQAIIDRTPQGRWGEPGDVAGPTLFLCSDAARFITGAVLPVDGGYLIA